MTLPVGTISMSQVNTELGLPSTTTISLNQANVRSIAGVLSGTISMNDLRGKTAFTLGFSPNVSINLQSSSASGPTSVFVSFPWETEPDPPQPGVANRGDISLSGGQVQSGPTAWGSPFTPAIGLQYEVRVIIDYINSGGDVSGTTNFSALGVNYTGPATTPWNTIISVVALQCTSAPEETTGFIESGGQIQIRNPLSGETISTPYYTRAAGAAP
jgi:hypothetical protein